MSSPHESPGDGGVSVAPEAPYLSVVVTARNDVAWNPPAQYATVTEWTDRMRRFHAPMIFTLRDWRLADRTLPETAVQAEA